MQTSPLHAWIAAELGQSVKGDLDLESLRWLQLQRLNGTIAHASANSPFYREHLRHRKNRALASLSELADLPFTTADDLRRQGLQMLSVSQGNIDRVVTLESSGTTGNAKRLYFTREDLARTQSFFRCGMSQVVRPGHVALVLLPGELPASAGDLLARALEPMGVTCRVAGLVTDPGRCAALLAEEPFDCVVGIPVQVLSVLRHPLAAAIAADRIKSVFLTSDYVPSTLVTEISQRWGCPAFNHYGMTEMGLTGGVECLALSGYHLRELDLYFEVVDPASGQLLPEGEPGEVVVSTLTRTGMPLIRYRTDDLARFLPEPCSCGSNLPRLAKLQGRSSKQVALGAGLKMGMPELDEALFLITGLINFRAVLTEEAGMNHLALAVETVAGREQETLVEIDRRLPAIGPIRRALKAETLRLSPTALCDTPLPVSATIKRNIEHLKELTPCEP